MSPIICEFSDARDYLTHLNLGLAIGSALRLYEELNQDWPKGVKRSLTEISCRKNWQAEPCKRLLRLLVYLKLLEETKDGLWRMPVISDDSR